MLHKCTRCKKEFDNNESIINGCTCGSKLFYFLKDKSKKPSKELKYFYELEDDESNEIIALDLETINIIENGKYEIDIGSLMQPNDFLVYKFAEGKYSIDILQDFSKIKYRK